LSVGARPFRRPPQDIVEVAQNAGDFTILLAALEATGLDEALKGDGPFTVFAPPDPVFEQLLSDLGISAEDLLANPGLADILLYHVLGEELWSFRLAMRSSVETLQGSSAKVTSHWPLFFRFRKIFIDDARVVKSNILASNGIIHVIDGVLMPPKDIVETAQDAGNFSILLAALEETGLDDVLREEGPFTVFAPPDPVFEALLEDLGISAADLLANPDLAEILLYHVLNGAVESRDLRRSMSVETVQGGDLHIRVFGPRFFWRRIYVNDTRVVKADILASNGVIHVINGVLMPPEE
jgi:uncharacterized surface protein with fasciclin (FAS1) repeats